MKRKGFLRSLATFIAAPSLIENVDKSVVGKIEYGDTDIEQLRKMPLDLKDCYHGYTQKEILEIYNQTANLIYQNKL